MKKLLASILLITLLSFPSLVNASCFEDYRDLREELITDRELVLALFIKKELAPAELLTVLTDQDILREQFLDSCTLSKKELDSSTTCQRNYEDVRWSATSLLASRRTAFILGNITVEEFQASLKLYRDTLHKAKCKY